MPVLNNKEELIAALQNSVFSADPIADLAHKGYTLSADLNKESGSRAGRKETPADATREPGDREGHVCIQTGASAADGAEYPPGKLRPNGWTYDRSRQRGSRGCLRQLNNSAPDCTGPAAVVERADRAGELFPGRSTGRPDQPATYPVGSHAGCHD